MPSHSDNGQRATAVVVPVKVRHYDRELHADVLSVVGYRVRCRCGWESSKQPSYSAARGALIGHRAEHLSPSGETGA